MTIDWLKKDLERSNASYNVGPHTIEIGDPLTAIGDLERAVYHEVGHGTDLAFLKNHFNSLFLFVTPGIRMTGDVADDQIRTMTPSDAIKAGSSHLVIGRPINQSDDPLKTLEKIYFEINQS